ncbi:MAG TPA: transaminase [Actinomycetes bacterium]|nr:transaminase [Actinomycetes bacterium]
MTLDRSRLASLIERERGTYAERHPKSRAAFEAAQRNLFGGVPMTWMGKWAGGFPLYLAAARGNRISDIDGHSYVDFALGDTGAMAGHSPEPTVRAITSRIADRGGFTTMLPSEDASWVGAELERRFGVPLWSFSLTATDANRWALRLARLATGRSKVLAFSYCYHGSVDETVVVLGPNGETLPRPGNAGPAVDPAETTRVAEFNDLASVERALAHGDVAVLITEPALTNIGIVLPEPGFLEGLRDLCTKYGTLLLIDETHTFSAGPGGMTKANNLEPDIVVIGKSIAGGIPIGTYGISEQLARTIESHEDADLIDVGGVGGTLAGNAVSIAAARATLEEVLTDEAFTTMIELATRFTDGVQNVLDKADVPWSISQLGARAEYRFARPAPTTGTASNEAGDDELDEYMHLYTVNRGILMTPFHNMALMCPATTEADVDLHTRVFAEAIDELYG